jgi:predicted ATPase
VLKRLYVDNYKCLVNFGLNLQPTQLFLGANGSGKSAVFDLLWRLQQVITGEKKISQPVDPPFPSTSLTRWDKREEQTFELDVEGSGGTYQYKLKLEHKPETRQCRIISETLNFNGKPLLSFVNGDITIYLEDHRVGAQFSFDRGQSAFVTLAERKDNRLHRWFRDWMGQLQVVCPNPFDMVSYSDHEDPRLNGNATNFVSWYRHVTDEMLGFEQVVRQSLADVWDGFQGMRLETVGPNVKVLKAVFQEPGAEKRGTYEVAFGDLSDGQRVLIALYTLLRSLERAAGSLACLDEPDNFVTLAEIQPWLISMCQAAEDHPSQVLVISHHPELINYFAPEKAIVFRRDCGGPTRVTPFDTSTGSTLTPAEVIARGWESE